MVSKATGTIKTTRIDARFNPNIMVREILNIKGFLIMIIILTKKCKRKAQTPKKHLDFIVPSPTGSTTWKIGRFMSSYWDSSLKANPKISKSNIKVWARLRLQGQLWTRMTTTAEWWTNKLRRYFWTRYLRQLPKIFN